MSINTIVTYNAFKLLFLYDITYKNSHEINRFAQNNLKRYFIHQALFIKL